MVAAFFKVAAMSGCQSSVPPHRMATTIDIRRRFFETAECELSTGVEQPQMPRLTVVKVTIMVMSSQSQASEAVSTQLCHSGDEVAAELSAESNRVMRREPALNAQTRRSNPTHRAQVSEDIRERDETIERLTICDEESLTIVGLDTLQSCPKCLENGINLMCNNNRQLAQHMNGAHVSVKVTWLCAACDRPCFSLQSLSCHKPHCKGRSTPVVLPFKCLHCNLSFATQVGLSQHERHEHEEVRNDKRAALAEAPKSTGGRRPSVWTDDELGRVAELERLYANSRRINVEIAEHFPDRTDKQVSDARRRLSNRAAQQEAATAAAEVEQASLAPRDPLPPSMAGSPNRMVLSPRDRGNTAPGQDEESSDGSVFEEAIESLNTALLLERTTPPSPDEDWRNPIRMEVCSDSGNAGSLSNWVSSIQELVYTDLDGELIESAYEQLTHTLLVTAAENKENKSHSNVKRPSTGPRRHRSRRLTKAEKKRFAFARCQSLWDNCPRKLAEIVVENDLSLLQRRDSPRIADIRALYGELWGVTGPTELPPVEHEDPIAISRILRPVTPEEVGNKLKRIKNDSAAGPDGVKKSDLRGRGVQIALSKLYNVLLLAGYYPKAWRTNRTTLLPKAGKDLNDVRNWRPITISSMISRLFSGLLDQRLRAFITQSDRQKGFTEENGCFSNARLLGAAIKQSKKEGGIISILDVSKAFDTVPHSAIKPSLERKGIPSYIADYVAIMYRDCSTTIRGKDGSVEIGIKRGVKQGDPLSPLIFNLAVEPLLERLEKTKGVTVEGNNLSVLAFADDITCLAYKAHEASEQLRMVNEFLSEMDMSLSISKCVALEYVPSGKTWYVRDPKITLNDLTVPYLSAGDTVKYLGSQVSPWRGLLKGFELDGFKSIIERVQRLPMKPRQKVELLTLYLFPKYTHGLIMSPPSRAVLKQIDQVIRNKIKEILHLPATISSSFLYAPKRAGGLGLLEIEKMVLIAALRSGLKALDSPDLVTRAVMSSDDQTKTLKTYAKALRLNWPANSKELDVYKNKLRQSYVQQWAKQKWQGQGAVEFAGDPVCNKWLSRSDLLPESRYIDAIKLRTNTYPTRALMKIVDGRVDSSCRKCMRGAETLAHIIGKCRFTKPERIHRHNEIKDLLKARLEKQHQVLDEPEIKVQNQRLKPDLVVKTNEGRVLVLDITVRYEHRDYLAQGLREKVGKYTCLLDPLKRDLQGTTGEVLPIVVGSRGAIPLETRAALRKLGFGRRDWLTISMIALRSSLEIVNAFMDD